MASGVLHGMMRDEISYKKGVEGNLGHQLIYTELCLERKKIEVLKA